MCWGWCLDLGRRPCSQALFVEEDEVGNTRIEEKSAEMASVAMALNRSFPSELDELADTASTACYCKEEAQNLGIVTEQGKGRIAEKQSSKIVPDLVVGLAMA